jgi:histidinol phosphatase-like PHP family hydrolase
VSDEENWSAKAVRLFPDRKISETFLDFASPTMLHIDQDLHIHTYLSACCKDKDRQRPGAILELAEQMGVKTVGFADHIWVNPDLRPSKWYRPQDETQTARLRADLSSVATGVRVLVGCEAEMIGPGTMTTSSPC